MKEKICNVRICAAGLTALASAFAAQSARAAACWTGDSTGSLVNKSNYQSNNNTWSVYLNTDWLTGNKRTSLWIKSDCGKFKLGDSSAVYKALFVQNGTAWQFHTNFDGPTASCTYDNSAGSDSSNDKDRICIAANKSGGATAGDAALELYDIKVKTKYLYVGSATTKGILTVQKNDAYDMVLTTTDNMYLQNGAIVCNGGPTVTCGGDLKLGVSGTTATLTVNGGTFEVASGKWTRFESGGSGTINLNGGILKTRYMRDNSDGAGSVVFNGGTLLANGSVGPTDNPGVLIDPTVNVMVGAKGGTIHTGGLNVTLGTVISDLENESGGMTFKGGGAVTITAAQSYTGKTTVEVGTTVHVPAPGYIGGGLAVSVPADAPANGFYTLLVCDGEGVFTDAVLTDAELPEGATLSLSQDGKSVLCTCVAVGPVWIGGTSGSLDDASNWANGAVPGAGTNCVIGVSSEATLTNPAGSAFVPASITFPAYSAAVTIDGEAAISGIAAVTNLSSTANHVFNVAVSGPDNAAVVMNTWTYCVFDGGMTAYDVDFSQSPESDDARTLAGQWTLTTTDDWTPPKNATVADGASLTVRNYSNSASDTLLVNAGGVVTAEVAKVTGSANGWLTRGIYGTMVVTGECKMDSTAVNRFVSDEASTGKIVANKLSSTSTSIKFLLKGDNGFRHVVGAGGISGTGWTAYTDWNPVIACADDFEITGTVSGYSSGTMNTYTLDTTGGHRVALASGGSLTGSRMALDVTGDGTFALAGGSSDIQKGLTVNSGATLEVAQSGAVAVGCDIAFADRALLAFNFANHSESTKLALGSNVVTAEGVVKVAVRSGFAPSGGTHVLTSGGKFSGIDVVGVGLSDNATLGVNADGDIYVKFLSGMIFKLW